jgi:hypothetical protein
MTNLPARKDQFSDAHVRGELLWLDEKQVKFIESAGRVKLTNALIAELSFAMDRYILSAGKKAPAVSGAKTRKVLRTMTRNLDALILSFLADPSAQEVQDARQKLESELWFLSRTDRDIPGLSHDKLKKLHERRVHNKPLVDTVNFQAELVYLRYAARATLERLERETKDDKKKVKGKSRKEAAFDRFLDDLEGIYKRSSGMKANFMEFLLAAHETLPEKNRPRLPRSWEALRQDQ